MEINLKSVSIYEQCPEAILRYDESYVLLETKAYYYETILRIHLDLEQLFESCPGKNMIFL